MCDAEFRNFYKIIEATTLYTHFSFSRIFVSKCFL